MKSLAIHQITVLAMWKTLITGSVVTGDLMMKLPNQPNLSKMKCAKCIKKHRNRLSSSGYYFSTSLIDKSQIQVLLGLLEPWKRYISIRKYISTTDIDMALHQWVSANDTVLDRVRSHCEWETGDILYRHRLH